MHISSSGEYRLGNNSGNNFQAQVPLLQGRNRIGWRGYSENRISIRCYRFGGKYQKYISWEILDQGC